MYMPFSRKSYRYSEKEYTYPPCPMFFIDEAKTECSIIVLLSKNQIRQSLFRIKIPIKTVNTHTDVVKSRICPAKASSLPMFFAMM